MTGMKPLMAALLTLALCLAAISALAEEQAQEMDLLFVQCGTSFTVQGSTLTILGVEDTLWFTDRPERMAGTMTNEAFAELWMSGDLHEVPPNAVLSVPGEPPMNVVLELAVELGMEGDAVTYQVLLLWGELPPGGGPCSLYIDPGSVNGQVTDGVTDAAPHVPGAGAGNS